MGKSGPYRLTGSKSLGDVGFLLFFRVVSGDYGKPCICMSRIRSLLRASVAGKVLLGRVLEGKLIILNVYLTTA